MSIEARVDGLISRGDVSDAVTTPIEGAPRAALTFAAAHAVGVALLLVCSHAARADETATATPNAPAVAPEPKDETVVRPYLQVGFVAGSAGDGGVAGDLGLRVDRVLVRFSYRLDIGRTSGYLTYASGRAGYILTENSWVAVLAGAGAGGLTYHYDDAYGDAGTATVAAAVKLLSH